MARQAFLGCGSHHHAIRHLLKEMLRWARLGSLRSQWAMAGQTGSIGGMENGGGYCLGGCPMAANAFIVAMTNKAFGPIESRLDPVCLAPEKIVVASRFFCLMASGTSLFLVTH